MSLPHLFRDPSLLDLALTHSSTGAEANNERLEFLGDAVLDLFVADELYHAKPFDHEGDLTEAKADIVSRRSLAESARALGLEGLANVGSGMRGRALPRSVLANLYEAVLGAVYLDAGYAAAVEFARRTLHRAMQRAMHASSVPNPKQALQHLAQARTGEPPRYAVLTERGQAHSRAFLVAAEIAGERYPSAWGRTRKEAERWAAHEALLVLTPRGEEDAA